ncbi:MULTISPECIES: hypothetical protein [Streptomyces]|uniref:hypothetical protein n=1 Tax=Streptomyces TaxID=1883 RepID=UPI0004CC99D8|nr:hypothetical protein [Streptomyces durhamensis]
MIQHFSHKIAGLRPADVTLALSIVRDLHAPVPTPRVPGVAAPPVPTELMGLRTSPARLHRRKVPLRRLTAVQA